MDIGASPYLQKVKPETVRINLDVLVATVKKLGKVTTKQVADELGRSSGWASAYLGEAVRQGRLRTDGRGRPMWWFPGSQSRLQHPTHQLGFKKSIIDLLKALQQVYGYPTLEEAAEQAIRGFAVKISQEDNVNLVQISAEIERHEARLNRLLGVQPEEPEDE